MAQLPFSIIHNRGANTNTLDISGSLVINYIEKIYDALSNDIDLTKNLNIRVKDVESIDITFIQVLFSLKKEFDDLGLTLNISLGLNDDSWSLLQNAGFKNQFIN
ncbi:MAG: hypothetical protein QM786_19870 [Breznakibacter sp.]